MQVQSGTVAGRPHEGDRLSRGNDVARLHERPVEVAVERAQLRIAGNPDVEAVASALASDRHAARSGGGDARAERSGEGEHAGEVGTRAVGRPGRERKGGAADGR